MNIFLKVQEIFEDLLDIEKEQIALETYIIRDLDVESIDLLELAVALNSNFHIEVNDDEVFLIALREYLEEAKKTKKDAVDYLGGKYQFLDSDRINEILSDLEEGPVLKIKDLINYVIWQQNKKMD